MLPAVLVLGLALLRVDVKKTLGASIAAGCLVCVLVQHMAPVAVLDLLLWGFQPENERIAAMMQGGGVLSMLSVMLIVCLSSCYAGIFEGTGLLRGFVARIHALCLRVHPFAGVLCASIVTSLVACNQTLAVLLTHQLCQKSVAEKERFALMLEDSVVVIAPLVPWSIAGAVPLASISAPVLSLAAACYLYFLPLWRLALALKERRVSGS